MIFVIKMRILVGNNHLQKTGGTENYTFALAVELQRLGHEVEYFTFEPGEVSEKLETLGISSMSHKDYDLILANHNTVVEQLCPYGYVVQTCHGTVPELEQPSPYADSYVSVTAEVRDHLRELGFDSELMLNGIDCHRFAPHVPLSSELGNVLSLCQSDEINAFIRECCEEIGVGFKACNKFTDNVWEVEKLINQADLVVGIGRSLYDAMACGRCVVSFDNRSYVNEAIGDGYLTAETIEKSIYHNCSGRGLHRTFTKEELIAELKRYRPEDGAWLRAYALKHLNIAKSAQRYLAYYNMYKEEEGMLKAVRNKITGMLREYQRVRDEKNALSVRLQSVEQAYAELSKQEQRLDALARGLKKKNDKHLGQVRILGVLSGILAIVLLIVLLG